MEFSRRTGNLIAALRGVPADKSRAVLRPAFTMASLLAVLEEKYKIGEERLEDHIGRHWKEIVGEQAAHRSSPQRIIGGSILMIQVANPILRQELQFKQRKILDAIHRLPGGPSIHALNFRAG